MANNQNQQMPQMQSAGPSQANAEEAARRNAEQEVMKNSILTQVLDQNARARINTLAAVKPDKAKAVENMIINMARSGQIREKLSDEQFRGILDQISEKTTKTTSVKFDRRRAAMDSDEDD